MFLLLSEVFFIPALQSNAQNYFIILHRILSLSDVFINLPHRIYLTEFLGLSNFSKDILKLLFTPTIWLGILTPASH